MGKKPDFEAAVEAYLNDTYETKEAEAEGQKYLISGKLISLSFRLGNGDCRFHAEGVDAGGLTAVS
ncbi:MAG: hypothetical protein ACLUTU_14405 [Blautia faecis]